MSAPPRTSDDRGAALIETALVLGLLLMIALGAFEYGMAFREWLSVTNATREGARLAAQAGNHPDADCLVLEATAGALQSLQTSQIESVTIFKSNESGDFTSDLMRYRPAIAGDPAHLLRCNGGWFFMAGNWPSNGRDNQGSVRDWVGVRLVFEHSWITGFAWWNGSVEWTDDTIMRMEPNYDF